MGRSSFNVLGSVELVTGMEVLDAVEEEGVDVGEDDEAVESASSSLSPKRRVKMTTNRTSPVERFLRTKRS